MATSVKNNMIELEEIKPKLSLPNVDRGTGLKLKYSLIILFVITLLLECANLTLTSKCESHSDASSTLETLISNSLSLSEIMMALEERDAPHTTTTSSTSNRVNKPMCTLQNEFFLGMSDKRVNVCTYQGSVRVDVRQFLNGRATIKGIFLTPSELTSLRNLLPLIKKEVDRQLTNLNSTVSDVTSSLCAVRKEFLIEMSNIRVTVCTYQDRVRVDVRHFLKGFATTKGIFFNTRELSSIIDLFPVIQDEVDSQLANASI